MQIPSLIPFPVAASTLTSQAAAPSPTPFKETLEKLSPASDADSAARKKAEDAAAGLVS